MSNSQLPTEVELVYEVMPCIAMRTGQEPINAPHPCTYFRKWGTYHSYDYKTEGPPPEPGIFQDTVYLGRAPLVPEVLSGCRKAPLVSIGINPNLPGWWRYRRGSLNPLFDDYKQFAHYFRYRSTAKLELSRDDYEQFGGGSQDNPFSDFELNVPQDADGLRSIQVKAQPVKMYLAYQALLDSLADEMGWEDHTLLVGEDLAYGNMVACPSARWTTRYNPDDPTLPPMTQAERRGIVSECFRQRVYFLRQLFQALPSVLLIFSRSTASAFIQELQDRFVEGDPDPGESIQELMQRPIRLAYGDLPDGSTLEARVIFAPHITGDPGNYEPARKRVVEQLVEEAQAGHLSFNEQTKHLARPVGGCRFCPMLDVGPCNYAQELQPLADAPQLAEDSGAPVFLEEKQIQNGLIQQTAGKSPSIASVWDHIEDDPEEVKANMAVVDQPEDKEE